MGTTAQKLEYLGTTKSQLKDMINYGLDDNNKITSSTTFREYVSSIFNAFLEALRTPDTLFTNLPKKSGTGAVISLNDTANAPMRIELGASELEQETTTGKNKLNVSSNYSVTGSIEMSLTLPAGTYHITCEQVTNGGSNSPVLVGFGNWFYLKSNGDVTRTLSQDTTLTLEFYSNGYNYSESQGVTSIVNNLMISTTGGTYEPYTNGASPNPSYPQDIHTISGSNKVVVQGQNLFDGTLFAGNTNTRAGITTTVNNDGSITFNGRGTDNYAGYIALSIPSMPSLNGKKLTISTTSNNSQVGHYLQNPSGYNQTITYDSSQELKVMVQVTNALNYEINETFNVQVELGDTATTYTPFVSQEADIDLGDLEYCKIGNYEDKFIRTSGKNLIPFTNQDFTLNSVHYFVQDGSLIFNGTSTSETSSKNANFKNNFSFTLEAGTYTISHKPGIMAVYLYNYDNDNTTIITLGTDATSSTFTLNAKTKLYIGFYVYQKSFSNVNSEIMISKDGGEYEPYGNGTWYIKKNIGKVVLDGTSTINDYVGALTNVYVFTAPMNNMNNITSSGAGFCNMYNTIAWNYNLDSESYYLANSTLAFKINKTTIDAQTGSTNKEKCLSFLGTTNLILYGSLTTPTYTQITGTLAEQLENVYQKLLSYSGTTNISQVNNDLSFNLSVQAIEEL